MRDGRLRRVVKRLALWAFALDVGVHRARLRRRGQLPYVLGGDCRRCAACCEAPAIRVGSLTWHVPLMRRAFLAWHRRVNGFELVETRRSHTFVFRCTHFDPVARACDSYDSRPGMCRDYPRLLLEQARPEFLPGCGYRAIARNADRLRAALDTAPLSDEARRRLRRELFLD